MTSIVIPVRGTNAKSRLAHPLRAELARAMALDTIAAAVQVADVIVVTDETMRLDAESLGARTVADPESGLNRAIHRLAVHAGVVWQAAIEAGSIALRPGTRKAPIVLFQHLKP